eukprot:tig00020850_g14676.t1
MLCMLLPHHALAVYSFAYEGAVRYTWAFGFPRGLAHCPATKQLFGVGDSSSATIYKVNTTSNDNATYAGATTLLAGIPGVVGTADGYGTSATIGPGGFGILLNDLCTHMYFTQGVAIGSTGVGLLRRIRMNDSYVDTPLQIPSGVEFGGLCIGIDYRTLYYYANGQVFRTDLLTWSTPQAIAGQAGNLAGYADGVGTFAQFRTLSSIVEVRPGVLYATDVSNGAIRRIEVATGAVTTVAGQPPPTANQTFSDGVGTSARLANPFSAQYYRPGETLYFAELRPQCLRKLHVPTALVTTIMCASAADGRGTDPWLAGMALDPPRSLAFLSWYINTPLDDLIVAVDVAFPTPATRPAAARPASCTAGTACVVLEQAGSLGLGGGASVVLG